MQVLPCSGAQYPQKRCNRDISFEQFGAEAQLTSDIASKSMESHCNGASSIVSLELQRSSCESDNCNNVAAKSGNNEFLNGNTEVEPHLVDPKWLQGDESLALWVKWRGKWQVGIRCSRVDWPLSALKAKPAHDMKKDFVVFFPETGIHSWADILNVCPISENPHPIGHKTRRIGMELVSDLTVARRFIMQNLAIAMLNVVEQFHVEALIATAREVGVWKEFALEASRCNTYPELGRMLLKLQNMISTRYINAEWLLSSFSSWVQRCQNTNNAESVEMLEEELFSSIRWNEIQSLRLAQVQHTLDPEWKTWKQEVMGLFSTADIQKQQHQQQQSGDGSLSPQVSRKRPKLEVRRAEYHTFLAETRVSDQSGSVEIDSEFFNYRDVTNEMPANSADKWNGIVVQPGNRTAGQTNGVETTPAGQSVGSMKALDSGNKNRQCSAYIESKGRQCVRWANDGDVYCCVHLSSRFTNTSAKEEASLFADTPMCDGTTVLGSKCKHRSLPGTSFCKKHRPKTESQVSNFSENQLNRKYEEKILGQELAHGKELAFAGDDQLPVDPNTTEGVQNPELLRIEPKRTEELRCIGLCSPGNDGPCLESPKRHGMYCEKHLPSWLKRARNGKSRIVSKEVFLELLRDCHEHNQKACLHQACELFYRLFKSILSLRNPVPKNVQFQWALSEASKDSVVGDLFMRLVSGEKERLFRIWGFGANEAAQIPISAREEPPAQLTGTGDCSRHNDDNFIKCKVCTEPFLDGRALGDHWRDNHKKEAQWLFRGYACAICLDSFTSKELLESHVQERHHVQFVEQCMLLQCIPCGGHFGNAEELWKHVLSVHPDDFRLSSEAQPAQRLPVMSPLNPDMPSLSAHAENNNPDSLNVTQRFICKLCGQKFDLLPDLGRHHQATHMGPSLVSSRPAKRGVRYYAYRMKSGRLSRPKFKKTAAAASYRIRNRAADNMKKRIQALKVIDTGGVVSVEPRVAEALRLSNFEESQCTYVSQILFSEIQKTKHRPNNSDILFIARSACCKINLKASLEARYGVLPERLYLKAAKICGENNILVTWHRDGFVCPKGCREQKDPRQLAPLKTLTRGIVRHESASLYEPINEKCQIDEFHYVLDAGDLGRRYSQNYDVLCEDISLGKESVSVACVADQSLTDSDSILASDRQSGGQMPWESFTYITEPLIDQSLSIDSQSYKMGCLCPRSICCPETCDHVYLFDCDYDDARDIYGKPMRGRFPYDERSRIILEEGYLVYECNQMCSCPKTCPNRVLQNGLRLKLEVFKTEEKGWAVRAAEAVMRGTFICEYIGEVLDEHEANLRRERYGKEGCGYLFEMDSHVNDMSRLVEDQSRYVIDATKYGNVSRFINHSCLPNLVSHQVLVESMDCQSSHIGLYANRDISLGEELTFDYRYSFHSGEGFSCRCGTSNCRGKF